MSNPVISKAHQEGKWEIADYTLAGNLRTPCSHFRRAMIGRSYHYLESYSYFAGAATAALALPGVLFRALASLSTRDFTTLKGEVARIETCVKIIAKGTVGGIVSLAKSVLHDRSTYLAREKDRREHPKGHAAFCGITPQYDYLPEYKSDQGGYAGGKRAVTKGDKIIPVFNEIMELFDVVVFSQECYPGNHGSFAVNLGVKEQTESELMGIPQRAMPKYCVQGSEGARIASELNAPKVTKVVQIGFDWLTASSGAFCNKTKDGKIDPAKMTELDEYLKSKNIKRIYFGGLPIEESLKDSVLQALELKYDVYVVTNAIRGFNIPVKDRDNNPIQITTCPVTGKDIKQRTQTTNDLAMEAMKRAGAKFIKSDEIADFEASLTK